MIVWKRIGAALLLLAACGAGRAEPVPEARGALVVIGGALRADNAEVWERIVRLAGGKGAAIAVFPTASGNPARAARNTAAHLERYGARPFVMPIGAGLGAEPGKAADDPALAAQVSKAGGVFFTGGDQGRITAALLRPDGSRSRVLDAVWALYREGGVIAGTSAGAAMMSTTMFHDAPPTVLPLLKGGVTEGREIAPGLGFAGPDIFIDQHLLVRGRFARMLPAMLAKGYRLGLGVDENSAVVLEAGGKAQVIGYKGALLLDLSAAASDRNSPKFKLSNARISYLDSGDRIDFRSGRLTPGSDKEKLDPARPYVRGPLFYADILAHTMVVDLLEKLADSDQQRAIGLAFGGPASPEPETGFEFVFQRVPETEAYVSNRAEAYSVYRVRMDVRPVRVRQPIYEVLP